jgi:hypothetical protein
MAEAQSSRAAPRAPPPQHTPSPVSVDMAVSHASIFWYLSGPMYCCMAMLSRGVLGTSSLSAPRGLGGSGNRMVMAGALRTCGIWGRGGARPGGGWDKSDVLVA